MLKKQLVNMLFRSLAGKSEYIHYEQLKLVQRECRRLSRLPKEKLYTLVFDMVPFKDWSDDEMASIADERGWSIVGEIISDQFDDTSFRLSDVSLKRRALRRAVKV